MQRLQTAVGKAACGGNGRLHDAIECGILEVVINDEDC